MRDRKTHKHVRNILANELGITKETVLSIIDDRIKRLLLDPGIETVVNRAVVSVITGAVKDRPYSYTDIRTMVKDAASDILREKLVLSIKDSN